MVILQYSTNLLQEYAKRPRFLGKVMNQMIKCTQVYASTIYQI
jgi:hypothetical protein